MRQRHESLWKDKYAKLYQAIKARPNCLPRSQVSHAIARLPWGWTSTSPTGSVSTNTIAGSHTLTEPPSSTSP